MKDQNINIRLANVYDAGEYSRLRNGSFDSFFSQQKFTKEDVEKWLSKISNQTDCIYVAEEDGKLMGTVSIYNITKTSAEVGRIIVDPNHRKKGLGISLLSYMEECGRTRNLENLTAHIMVDNTSSQYLFKKAGYVQSLHNPRTWELKL